VRFTERVGAAAAVEDWDGEAGEQAVRTTIPTANISGSIKLLSRSLLKTILSFL
jgi:hypothetical protein